MSSALVLQDIQDTFKAIFDDTQQVEAWNIQYLDKTYLLDKSTVNPVAINALFVSWYKHETVSVKVSGVDTNVTISVTYVYFMGVCGSLCDFISLTHPAFWLK